MHNSKVIVKSIIDPDDTFSVDLLTNSCLWWLKKVWLLWKNLPYEITILEIGWWIISVPKTAHGRQFVGIFFNQSILFLENVWRRNAYQHPTHNSPSDILWIYDKFQDHQQRIDDRRYLLTHLCWPPPKVAWQFGEYLTLPMLRLLASKAQGCKDFWKPSKPWHVGIHWIFPICCIILWFMFKVVRPGDNGLMC